MGRETVAKKLNLYKKKKSTMLLKAHQEQHSKNNIKIMFKWKYSFICLPNLPQVHSGLHLFSLLEKSENSLTCTKTGIDALVKVAQETCGTAGT